MRSTSLISPFFAAAVLLFAAASAQAQNASTSKFDHAVTGFPLTGTHVYVPCASCHLNGRYKNTPTRCFGCHEGMTAPGATSILSAHPKTTNYCEGCHIPTTWRDYRFIDHTQALGPCANCHNGKIAQGKDPGMGHPITNAACNVCHFSTVTWLGGILAPGQFTPTPNFPAATGPGATAPAAAAPGATGPAAPGTAPTSAGGRMNHTGIIANCMRCHNGVAAPGKPTNHVATNAPCETCHKSTTTFAGARMNHVGIVANCMRCHNGVTAPGKPTNHVATNAPCETCHKSTMTFVGARFDHAAATGTCASCHNGQTATGKPPNHVATTAPCETCHKSTITFAGARMSHTGMAANCMRCHNGQTATGKPPNHVATNAPCETCHKSTITFAGARMNHVGIIGNCMRCHNGVIAPGKPQQHIATNAPCETCHKSTMTFVGARVDHASLTGPCARCHNGVTAPGKPPNHMVTTAPCESCHRTMFWTPVTSYRHMSPAYVNHGPSIDCKSCHIGNAQTVAWKFPAYRQTCAGCHADKYRPQQHVKFQRPVTMYYTVSELRDCAGACHTYTDNTMRTIVQRNFSQHRAFGGGW